MQTCQLHQCVNVMRDKELEGEARVSAYVCMYVCVYLCVCVSECVFMCLSECMCACVYVCYIYTWSPRPSVSGFLFGIYHSQTRNTLTHSFTHTHSLTHSHSLTYTHSLTHTPARGVLCVRRGTGPEQHSDRLENGVLRVSGASVMG